MTDAHSRHAQIAQEHEELRSLLAEVHHLLADQTESETVVAQKVELLFQHVATHFQEEETQGFFDQLVERAPQLSERVEHLCSQHGELLEEMGRVRSIAESNAADSNADNKVATDWWKRLQTAFHDFSKNLMHHENSENELLQQVYDDDLGTGD